MRLIEKECSFDEVEHLIYSMYSSKYNKETLETLEEDWSLPRLLKRQEFISIREDLEYEQHILAEKNMKKRSS